MQKHYMSPSAGLLILLFLSTAAIAFAQFAGGSGTQQDPYLIATPAQLSQINNLSNYLNSYYLQIEDIDLGVAPYNEGLGWLPIGYYNGNFTFFRGTYDGGGKTISNLYINRPGQSCIGLFGVTFDAVIRNVNLRNVNISGSMDVGGLIGSFDGAASNCSITGNVSSWNRAGGLIGYCQNGSTVTNCFTRGTAHANYIVGGLIASLHSLNVYTAVTNCYSTVALTQSLTGATGGLIHSNYESNSIVSNSYWDIELSGTDYSEGGLGRTTDEMTFPYAANTYAGWNFNSAWAADTSYTVNDGYPYLRHSVSGYNVTNPAFSPAAGTYNTPIQVTIQTQTTNASIFYTLDDTEPTEASLLYEAPIGLNCSATIKARAFKPGFNPSQTVQAQYIVHTDITVSAPVFSPIPGFYDTPVTVTISTYTENAEIYYTLDWSIPDQQSILYTGPIDIDTTTVFRARAFRTDWYPSDVVTAYYSYDVGSSDETLPQSSIVCSASPNPCRGSANFKIGLSGDSKIRLNIYNTRGQLVKTLTDIMFSKGEHNLTWDGTSDSGSQVSNGVYIYCLQGENFYLAKKLFLIK